MSIVGNTVVQKDSQNRFISAISTLDASAMSFLGSINFTLLKERKENWRTDIAYFQVDFSNQEADVKPLMEANDVFELCKSDGQCKYGTLKWVSYPVKVFRVRYKIVNAVVYGYIQCNGNAIDYILRRKLVKERAIYRETV